MAKSIVIIGATGQLGTDLMRLWPVQTGDVLLGLKHSEIEITDLESIRARLEPICPDIVINTSAYHKVDEVESNPQKAFAVNAIGPRNLAVVCKKLDAVLMHLSTDYVFSGSKGESYLESDPVEPVNAYGVSKAAGEMFIRSISKKYFIVRSSGLYGIAGPSGKGSNFVELMLKLARSGKSIKVVDDQVLTPTSTHILAEQIVALSRIDAYGTYHATCQGFCSWFEFARTIFDLSDLSPDLSAQTTLQSGATARRPSFSVLDNANLRNLGIDHMPPWKEALKSYLNGKAVSQN
ncbi:MAG: dTDP-4-dehydrorhamnose reductase [Acidobacteria bacterium]|nr:dTDP-4-dehydrorhamnose reductase [Acidobacteriota bacterium]